MRIGVLHQYGLLTSGSGVYAVRLVEQLVARGHHVSLISREPDPDKHGLRLLRAATPVGDRLGADEAGCRLHSLLDGPSAVAYPRAEMPYAPTFAALSDEELELWLAYNVDAITAIVREERLEVLHANHEAPMAFVAHEVSRRTGIPYVVVAHGSTLEYVCAADERYATLTRIGLEGAARVVALTSELRERLLELCPAIAPRLAVVAAGVDLDVFGPPSPVGPARVAPTIAYVGRMSLEKGVQVLLAALPEILHALPDARLRLVGTGPSVDALTEMTSALCAGDLLAAERILRDHALPGKEAWLEPVLDHWHGPTREQARVRAAATPAERVIFVGPLDSPGVAAELRGADLVVVPSLICEAFPLVTLEGLASGAPPVCADHGGLSAVLDELSPALGELGSELRVSMDGDVVANLADRVVRVLRRLEAPAGRARTIQSCRALAEQRYGWTRVAADLELQYCLAADADHGGDGRAALAASATRSSVPFPVTPTTTGALRS